MQRHYTQTQPYKNAVSVQWSDRALPPSPRLPPFSPPPPWLMGVSSCGCVFTGYIRLGLKEEAWIRSSWSLAVAAAASGDISVPYLGGKPTQNRIYYQVLAMIKKYCQRSRSTLNDQEVLLTIKKYA